MKSILVLNEYLKNRWPDKGLQKTKINFLSNHGKYHKYGMP